MKLIELKCQNCGAKLEVHSELNEISCSYCGVKNFIDDEATKISRVEKAKLNAKKDKLALFGELKKNKEKENKDFLKIALPIFVIFVIFSIVMGALFGEKNPTLSDYNSLKLGMTYNECKSILGSEGHLILEENGKTTYVWYDVLCSDDECPVLVELNFDNNKLISRNEDGLE